MTSEKWLIQPGQTRVIDIEDVTRLKIGLIGGQIDVVAHDEPNLRIEVHAVSGRDLRIEAIDGAVEIDHPQLGWDNFLDVFRHFGANGPKAEISVAVPRTAAVTLGVVSASALVSGLRTDARLNTVSGDLLVDGLTGDLTVNAVSGDVQIRGLAGALLANSVSGDVTASGSIAKAIVDTVSGPVLIDSTGDVDRISLNTVSGDATIRLDEGRAANYVVRSVSGQVLIDGTVRSGQGNGPGTSYTGTTGQLSGSFADVRTNSVSGNLSVLRRPTDGVDAAADAGGDTDATTEEEW
ncbi:DUF4097 family beta strand repeat-containing protein [Microbacterium horticulturae]|uniref:DUF4097 family beta strand repeat-containing protein n=1 Tax=Microbacterium horticulturae TaxID=3028316 RepID=A0ABY8BY48_9MICO|nr:DUF4097 family beta strand repeat-containing protein [Microbacterium sp. KACC 23027]WEG09098.1 DUF4097 family beta strand repeat-containing protein [Microbacterium sp. KACC 23027]